MNVDEHFLAFIDVLGFSDMVEADFSHAEIDEKSNLAVMLQAIQRIRELTKDQGEIGIQQFSDCIILYRRYDVGSFDEFAKICARLQADLVRMGVLVRGGLTYGKHFSEDGVVYSKALVDAYRLESQEAIYPRILVPKDLVDLIYGTDAEAERSEILKRDVDRYYFLNFGRALDAEAASEVIATMTIRLEKCLGRVAAKLAWLIQYLEESHEFV